MVTETAEEREAHLQLMSLNHEQRLANESQEEREMCLQQMSLNQERRLAMSCRKRETSTFTKCDQTSSTG